MLYVNGVTKTTNLNFTEKSLKRGEARLVATTDGVHRACIVLRAALAC